MKSKAFDKVLPYTYRITNVETNEFYIGYRGKNVRLGKTPNEDFFVAYFGSASNENFKNIKDNMQNYTFELLYTYDDLDDADLEARLHESEMIKEVINTEQCINGAYMKCANGRWTIGAGSGKNSPTYGYVFSEESKKKMSESHTGKVLSEEHKRKIGESGKGREVSEESRENYRVANTGEDNPMHGRTGENSPFYEVPRSEETRERIRQSLMGRKASDETKAKMREKSTCPHCGKTGGKGAMKRYHFDNCKHKINNPEG